MRLQILPSIFVCPVMPHSNRRLSRFHSYWGNGTLHSGLRLTFIDAQSSIASTQLAWVAKTDLVTVGGRGWTSPGQVTFRATEAGITSLHASQLGAQTG